MVRIHQKCHRDAKFQISLRLDIRNPVKMTPVPMLELDPRVIDGSGDGQDPSDISWRYKVSNFMEIGHQEPCQDDPYPPCWSWILE